MREKEFKAKDKKTHRMTRDGVVERNEATGEESRVSQRGQEFELRARAPEDPLLDTPNKAVGRRHRQDVPLQEARADESVPTFEGERPVSSRTMDTPLRPHEDAPTKPMQRGTKYQQKFVPEAAKPEMAAQADPPAPIADSGRLQFAADEKPPEPVGKKLTQASRRADKMTGKLEKAQKKLPSRRKARLVKEFDADKGKVKSKLHLESEVKSQRAHLKGALPLRPVKGAANVGIGYGHKKLYEVQHENVGTEAGHKVEVAAEGAARSAYRFHKTAPYRKVAKLQKKSDKANIKLAYQKTLHEKPDLKSNPLSRMWQKRKIKRQYAKAARKAKRAAQATKSIGTRVIAFIGRHPAAFAVGGAAALLFIFISSAFSSCSGIAMGGMSGIAASSYQAEDRDIDDAELYYTEWETDLLMEAMDAETSHPGYDEYRTNISDIGHNPYELMAYLTAAHQNFTYSGIQSELRLLFNEQYSLTFTPEVEVRYNDPNDVDGDGDTEPYDWNILNVSLNSRPLTGLLAARMSADEQAVYGVLMQTKGNRQYVYSPFDFGWMQYVTSYYGYRVHPTSGEKDYHKAVDIAVPQGIEIRAAHDGTVTTAARDASYGNYIVLEGEDGISTKYAHCQTLLVSAGQEVTKGTVIAKVGNTGTVAGANGGYHLHFEVLKDGRHLNPLYFAECPDDGSTLPPGSQGGPEYGDPGAPMGDGSYAAMLAEAQKHLGKPYVFGASGPTVFDCSGFVCWVLNQSGVRNVGRTTAQGLYNLSTPVSRTDARPGDLIFFQGTYSTPNTVTHVGIYLGDGQMIHCGDPIQYASIDTSYWQNHFYAFGRV